jgi:putative FmdB family regulatory protein
LPIYDFICANGHDKRDVLRSMATRNDPCPDCGAPITRMHRACNMIGDEIPGGQWVENLGPTPIKVHSKSELKWEAQKRGLVQNVRHVGVPGSDRSPHTSRWV